MEDKKTAFSTTACRIGLVILCITFLVMLFWRGFFDPDEGRYSEIPREMVQSGDWFQMRMLNIPYYEKPPVAYWCIAPAIALLGAHEQAVRIPLLITGILLLSVFYMSARKNWPKSDSLIAVACTTSSLGFVMGSCLLLTDPFLVLFFSITCLTAFHALTPGQTPRRQTLLLCIAGIAAALGFLTKGAIAVVLPGGAVFFWLLLERRLKDLFTIRLVAPILLFAIILAPILYLVEQHNPGFIDTFIFREHLARFLGTRKSQLHEEGFWFFLPIVPLLLFPWTLFGIRAIRNARKPGAEVDSFSRFLLIWAIVVVVFFSIGKGKLMSYILPAIPPLGMLLGRWGLAKPQDGSAIDRKLWTTGIVGVFIPAVALLSVWMLSFQHTLPLGDDKEYPATAISAISFLPFFVSLGAVWFLKKLRSFCGIFLVSSSVLLSGAIMISPLSGKDFNVLLHINSSHVYKALAARLQPEDTVVVFWEYRPALPFYTQRLYLPFQTRNELEYGMTLEPDKYDITTKVQLIRMMRNAKGRMYAMVAPEDLHKKYYPLKLPYIETDLPGDPDTIIFELLTEHTPKKLVPWLSEKNGDKK